MNKSIKFKRKKKQKNNIKHSNVANGIFFRKFNKMNKHLVKLGGERGNIAKIRNERGLAQQTSKRVKGQTAH